MKPNADILLVLAIQFALVSLVAIGGANAAMPEIHRQVVELRNWVTDRQFSELYAIAQAAPGPNVMIVTVIGYVVAGPLGAVVATLAMCGPTCLLAFGVSRVFERFSHAPWRIAIQAGLVPLTVGLIAATALILARAADRDLATVAITAGTFALAYWTRITPLWALGLAAALGALGIL
jgi:chromate transporter